MDIAKRGIIRFVAKICGTWKRTNLHPLQGFSWLEPQLTASKFAGVGCPQLTHIYSKYRNMICPQQLLQPQLQVSAPFSTFLRKMCSLLEKNKKGNEIISLLGILEESDLMRFDENLDCSPPGKGF